MPDIPEMVSPSVASTMLFTALIASIAFATIVGIWRGGPPGELAESRTRWGVRFATGMVIWILFGAIVPASGILETELFPPPPLFLIGVSFLLAFVVAFSQVGKRLSMLPLTALIGFHVFRLPLELILHNWYQAGTIPIQMTFEGHNFDIVSGILAAIVGIWAFFDRLPKTVAWLFNIIGTILLGVVVTIALWSSPFPFRQYMNDPPVLLVYYFPYSWIVTVAVTGALLGHLVLFRKLLD